MRYEWKYLFLLNWIAKSERGAMDLLFKVKYMCVVPAFRPKRKLTSNPFPCSAGNTTCFGVALVGETNVSNPVGRPIAIGDFGATEAGKSPNKSKSAFCPPVLAGTGGAGDVATGAPKSKSSKSPTA